MGNFWSRVRVNWRFDNKTRLLTNHQVLGFTVTVITPSKSPIGPTPASALDTIQQTDPPSEPFLAPAEPILRCSPRSYQPSEAAQELQRFADREAEARIRVHDWVQHPSLAAAATTEVDSYIPKSYSDAVRADASHWRAAMDDEYNTHLKRYTQQHGIDCTDAWAAVTKLESLRCLLP